MTDDEDTMLSGKEFQELITRTGEKNSMTITQNTRFSEFHGITSCEINGRPCEKVLQLVLLLYLIFHHILSGFVPTVRCRICICVVLAAFYFCCIVL